MTVRTEHTTTVVPGFAFAGVAAGIKSNGRPDLALAVADEAVPAAAVFTTNLVRAAPVLVQQSGSPRAKHVRFWSTADAPTLAPALPV